MTVSLFARKMLGSCGLILATSCLGFAEAPFTPLGTEYPVIDSRFGPQIRGSASINTNGGYLVWEDLAADTDGNGIMAQALNSRLSGSGAAFRVNQWRRGDQEKPQVALLNDGVVFAWQGGGNSKHIYARFLSGAKAWMGGDLLISSADGHSINPALARLQNGNVVVVYSSYNQRGTGSMMDIYGRLLSPAGQPLGPEFPINQIMTFNQRTPSVAALGDGKFVVVWVGEEQRSELSIDVFGRVFDAEGVPAGSEFLVNSGTNVCANPVVNGSIPGGFVVAWSQKDVVRTNGWEVMARGFDSGGTAVGQSALVNEQRFGDQFAPKLAGLDGKQLVVWTSLKQDKFSEGVFGRYVDGQGTPLASEFGVNSVVVSRQIQPLMASDGNGRMLAAWSSLIGGIRNNFDIVGQKYAAPGYVEPTLSSSYGAPTSDPYPVDPPPTNPGGGGGSSWTNWIAGLPTLAYPAVPAIPGGGTGVAAAAGDYYGLVFDTNGVKVANSGSASIKVTARQTYSMKLTVGRLTYGFSGLLTSDGRATRVVARTGLAPLRVELKVDLAGGEQITGRVEAGSLSADLVADKLTYNSRLNPAPQAGTYTVRFPAGDAVGNAPLGDGYGTVRVDGSGNLRFAGVLADGTAVSQKTGISRHGVWPLFASLYSGRGMLQSWMKFQPSDSADLAGQAVWIKQADLPGRPYAAGFTNEVAATGSRYARPAGTQKVLPLTAGQLILTGGGFSQSLTNGFALEAKNLVRPSNPAALKLSIVPASGLFRGTLLQGGQKLTFQGVVDTKGGCGTGFFLNQNLSGQVYLGAEQ